MKFVLLALAALCAIALGKTATKSIARRASDDAEVWVFVTLNGTTFTDNATLTEAPTPEHGQYVLDPAVLIPGFFSGEFNYGWILETDDEGKALANATWEINSGGEFTLEFGADPDHKHAALVCTVPDDYQCVVFANYLRQNGPQSTTSSSESYGTGVDQIVFNVLVNSYGGVPHFLDVPSAEELLVEGKNVRKSHERSTTNWPDKRIPARRRRQIQPTPYAPSPYEPVPFGSFEPTPYAPSPYEPVPFGSFEPTPYAPSPYEPVPFGSFEPTPYAPSPYEPVPFGSFEPTPYAPSPYEPIPFSSGTYSDEYSFYGSIIYNVTSGNYSDTLKWDSYGEETPTDGSWIFHPPNLIKPYDPTDHVQGWGIQSGDNGRINVTLSWESDVEFLYIDQIAEPDGYGGIISITLMEYYGLLVEFDFDAYFGQDYVLNFYFPGSTFALATPPPYPPFPPSIFSGTFPSTTSEEST